MCEPTTVAMLMMASTAFSLNEQRNQQKYASAVAQANSDQQNAAAMENFRVQNRQLNEMELQDQMTASTEKVQQSLGAQKAIASQRVSAGEGGVSGLSIDALFADIDRQAGTNITAIDRNLQSANGQRNFERKVVRSNTGANMSVNNSYKAKFGGLGAGLQIASAGVSGYEAAGGKFGK